jgi:hypothetical protein
LLEGANSKMILYPWGKRMDSFSIFAFSLHKSPQS